MCFSCLKCVKRITVTQLLSVLGEHVLPGTETDSLLFFRPDCRLPALGFTGAHERSHFSVAGARFLMCCPPALPCLGLASIPGTLELCAGERVEDCDETGVTHRKGQAAIAPYRCC